VEGAAANNGYTLIFGNTDENDQTERAYAEKLSSLHVDGVLLAPASNRSRETIDLLTRRGIPTVLIDREVEGINLDIARGESRAAASELTEHLLSHGHTRLAMVAGPSQVWTAQERITGFRAALRRRHVALDRRHVRNTELTRAGGAEATRRILLAEPRPTALLCGNGYLAAGAFDAARELGVRVPEDLAIATFDDTESQSQRAFFTCYEQPARAIGAAAVRFLLDRLAGDSSGQRRAVLRGDYRFRGSCGCESGLV
jgi:LacI family transcriptional regulator